MINSNACINPWSFLTVGKNSVQTCCYPSATGITNTGFKDDNSGTMWEIWNSEPMQLLRKEMLESGHQKLCFKEKSTFCYARKQNVQITSYLNLSKKQIKNFLDINRNYKDGKIILDSYPSYLTFFLDFKCNLNCPHCFQYAGRNSKDSYDVKIFEKPDVEEFLSHAERLNILGGEPTILKSYDKIIQYKKALPGLHLTVTTNGHFLEKKVIPNLDYINELVISVDGVTPEVYADIRPSPSGKYDFEHLCHQLELYKDASKNHNTNVLLNFTICSKNYEQMPAFVDFAAKYNIPNIYIFEVADIDYYWMSLKEQIKLFLYQSDIQRLRELSEETLARGRAMGVNTCIRMSNIDFYTV